MARNLFAGAGLVRALENEEDIPTDGAAVEAPPAAESAETELLDVAESSEEGAAEEAATEEAVEAVEALEAYATALEAAAENGGLDRHGARVLNIGLEGIYSKLGFRNAKAAVSLESFGGATSKVGATTLALEDVKEKIKEIWKAIVAAIKRAIAWVKGHFDKMFGAAQTLQKRAKALQEKAKNVSGTPKEKSFENERLVKALHVNGNVSTNIATELGKVNKAAEGVFGSISDFNAKTADEMLEALDKDFSGQTLNDLEINPPVFNFTTLVANPKDAGFGEPHEGIALVRSPEMLGGKSVIGEVPSQKATGEGAAKVITRMSAYLGAFNPKAKDPSKTSVQTLQPNECGKIGDEVETLMTEVINYKAKLNKAAELQDKLAKAADKLGKESTTEEDKDKAKAMSWAQKTTQAVVANLNRAPAAMSAYVLNVSKASLDYAELSLKQYASK